MRKIQIVNLWVILMNNKKILELIKSLLAEKSVPLSLIKDKVNYRRAHVIKFALDGRKQKEIAEEIHCSVSTIEKDFHAIRNKGGFKN